MITSKTNKKIRVGIRAAVQKSNLDRGGENMKKKEQKKEEQRKERKREKEKAKDRKEQKKEGKNYKGRCRFFMLTSLILLISVVSMMLLAATSDNVNILNYENKLIDKYSSWEQELEEREQAVKEQEQALEEK